MKRLFKTTTILGAAIAAAAVPMQAQQTTATTSIITGRPSVLSVTPYAGYMKFGELARVDANTQLSHKNGPLYGAQASLDVTRNLAFVGNFAYSKTQRTFGDGLGGAQDLSVGDVGFWLYDGNVELKAPLGVRAATFTPIVQAGVGQVRYSSDANDLSPATTSTAFNAGLGADFTVRAVGVRVMAKDYVTSLDWNRAENVRLRDNVKNNVAHNLAFTAGLKLAF
jgi:hypothetical protein